MNIAFIMHACVNVLHAGYIYNMYILIYGHMHGIYYNYILINCRRLSARDRRARGRLQLARRRRCFSSSFFRSLLIIKYMIDIYHDMYARIKIHLYLQLQAKLKCMHVYVYVHV